jgi:hypothetical protein
MKGLVFKKVESGEEGVFPTSREGHTITYIPDKKVYLLFGGISTDRYNDAFSFNSSK